MPKADTLTNDIKTSILLKAPYGFGKTIAACTMAVDGPIWLAYWDKSQPVELLTFFKKHRPDLLKNIDYDIYSAKNANEYLNKLIDCARRNDYYGHVNDSVTNMTSAAVNWSMAFRNPSGGKKDPLNKNAVQMIPDFDEYKVETSLVTQALDLCRAINWNVIWTAHPLPTMKIEGGDRMKISKVNSIVSYGSKVGAIVPGQFQEIYHLSMLNEWDSKAGKTIQRRLVNTQGIGDDFAKTSLNLPAELDITDKLFWEVWKAAVKLDNQ